jgi:hypothetical protein
MVLNPIQVFFSFFYSCKISANFKMKFLTIDLKKFQKITTNPRRQTFGYLRATSISFQTKKNHKRAVIKEKKKAIRAINT